MAVQSTGRPTGSRPGIAAALHLVLRLLALLVFAQAVFAGLFLDGNTAWRQWHAINGMLLIPLLALLAVVLAVVLWRSGGPSLHRPVRTQREAAMRITVFGATGRTGRYILAEGLRRDHQLTAYPGRQPWTARQHSRPSPWTTAATRIPSVRQSTVRTR
jgi:hypothetical protein